jgi:biofilm protein TabA
VILDSLNIFPRYCAINPQFNAVLSFVNKTNLSTVDIGRLELDESAHALVSEYQSKPVSDCFIECHRKFIDLQMVIQGVEKIGVCNASNCTEITAYDPEKDFQKLEGELDFITLKPGLFAVFFPQDGHMPGICSGKTPEKVRKIVFKIPI